MKASIILFIAISAALGHGATALSPKSNWPTSCPQNPFLPELKNNNVSLFEVPTKYLNNSCGKEWKTFGLCCKEADLLEYAKQDHQNITRAACDLVRKFSIIRNRFSDLRNKSLDISKEELGKLDPLQKNIFSLLRGNATQILAKRLLMSMAIKPFKAELTRCRSKIATSRSNALCSVCSARSPEFFSDNKILLLDTDCNSILEECAPTFKHLAFMIEVMGRFFARFERIVTTGLHKVKKDFNSLISLIKKIEEEKVQQTIKKYLSQEGEAKLKTAADLCSKLVEISEETFIEKTQSIVQNMYLNRISKKINFQYKNKVLNLRNSTNSTNHAQPNQANSCVRALKSPARRLIELQANPSLPEGFKAAVNESAAIFLEAPQFQKIDTLFTGDVLVVAKNTDSSYTSYFGANGTTVSTNIHGIPFNITKAFP